MNGTYFKRIASGFRTWTPLLTTVIATIAFRSAIADWNDVPTGSMRPTIVEGDRIIVNKLAYDLKVPFTTKTIARWNEPKRGDIVVFMSPQNGTRLVKRVIGVPGDTIEMKNECLIINGHKQHYAEHNTTGRLNGQEIIFTETLSESDGHLIRIMPDKPALRSFGPVKVPRDSYFMLGDNRDNSADSRYFGFVDKDAIVGQATRVAFSLNYDRLYMPRNERFLKSLYYR